MNPGEIPDNVLKCMRPEDRKAIGLHTVEEYTEKACVEYERKLQAGCENYLRLHGIEFLHISMRAKEKIGWPDLIWADPNSGDDDEPYSGNFNNGRFCAVELKSATGKVSKDQQRILGNLEKNGARVAVIRSLQDFIKFVNREV